MMPSIMRPLAVSSVALVEGHQLDAAPSEQGLVDHRVLSTPCETAVLPDEDHFEGALLCLGGLDHALEGGPGVGAGALGFVDELLDHLPSSSASLSSARVELGRDGQVLVGLTLG